MRTKESKIVVLGDSITAAGCYANILRVRIVAKSRSHTQWTLINAGRAGATTAGVDPVVPRPALSWLQPEVIAHQPQIVLILLGFNDLRNCCIGEEDFLANMRSIITAIQHGCDAKMVLGDMPHMIAYDEYGPQWNCGCRAKCDRFCQLVAELGSEYNLPVAQVHAAMNHDDSLVQDDGVHPNAKGHQVIAEVFWKILHDWDFGAIVCPGSLSSVDTMLYERKAK